MLCQGELILKDALVYSKCCENSPFHPLERKINVANIEKKKAMRVYPLTKAILEPNLI